jgi:hypothetical protein
VNYFMTLSFHIQITPNKKNLKYHFKYQGQERENTFALNLNEFEARHGACPDEGGNPQIGRWMVPDPAQQFPSPYVGMGNEWVSGVDPDGRFVLMPILVGALVGAGVSTATLATTVFLNGGSWSDMNLGRAAALGAIGGAVGAGFSMLGSSLGTLGQSMGYEMMSNVAGGAAVDLAFGNRPTVGSLAGSAIGGLIDGSIPRFKGFNHSDKYTFGDGLLNGISELGINTARGALVGGLSGGLGAEIDGGRFEDGFRNGLRTGAIGAGIRTSFNLAILGPVIRPNGEAKNALQNLEAEFGINLLRGNGTPTYRVGGIMKFFALGFNTGRSLMVESNTFDPWAVNTWIHESVHYWQQLNQTWAGQMGKGMYEQWYLSLIKGVEVYNYGVFGNKFNESAAAMYSNSRYNPIRPNR